MTAQAQHTGTAVKRIRRADTGVLRITQRDIDGLLLCADIRVCRTTCSARR
jgi:hypothetical protein